MNGDELGSDNSGKTAVSELKLSNEIDTLNGVSKADTPVNGRRLPPITITENDDKGKHKEESKPSQDPTGSNDIERHSLDPTENGNLKLNGHRSLRSPRVKKSRNLDNEKSGQSDRLQLDTSRRTPVEKNGVEVTTPTEIFSSTPSVRPKYYKRRDDRSGSETDRSNDSQENVCTERHNNSRSEVKTPTGIFERPTSADSHKSVKFETKCETITYDKKAKIQQKKKKRPGSASSDTAAIQSSLQVSSANIGRSNSSLTIRREHEVPPMSLEPVIKIQHSKSPHAHEQLARNMSTPGTSVSVKSMDDDAFTPTDMFTIGSQHTLRPTTASKVILEDMKDKSKKKSNADTPVRPTSAKKDDATEAAKEIFNIQPNSFLGRRLNNQTTQRKISPHLNTSICLLILCNVLGIPALVFSILTKRSLKAGNDEAAKKWSKYTKIYTIVLFVTGATIIAIVLGTLLSKPARSS